MVKLTLLKSDGSGSFNKCIHSLIHSSIMSKRSSNPLHHPILHLPAPGHHCSLFFPNSSAFYSIIDRVTFASGFFHLVSYI